MSERETGGAGGADPLLLILASLAGGPKHGYAMTEEIERLAGIRLGPGTLYGALARLVARGLIEPVESEDRRRPYRLTEEGLNAFLAEVAALERIATFARGRATSRATAEGRPARAGREPGNA